LIRQIDRVELFFEAEFDAVTIARVGLDLGKLTGEAGQLSSIGFLRRTIPTMLVGERAHIPHGIARIDVALVGRILATIGATGAFSTADGFGHKGIGLRFKEGRIRPTRLFRQCCPGCTVWETLSAVWAIVCCTAWTVKLSIDGRLVNGVGDTPVSTNRGKS
jgi:hypothetical protein